VATRRAYQHFGLQPPRGVVDAGGPADPGRGLFDAEET
jgi:hypothetical protein